MQHHVSAVSRGDAMRFNDPLHFRAAQRSRVVRARQSRPLTGGDRKTLLFSPPYARRYRCVEAISVQQILIWNPMNGIITFSLYTFRCNQSSEMVLTQPWEASEYKTTIFLLSTRGKTNLSFFFFNITFLFSAFQSFQWLCYSLTH